VKDKLVVEPGGLGKPEASYHQQQATEAVRSTIIAQLQATGRNPCKHITASACFQHKLLLDKPSVWQRYALPKLIIGKLD
jgi:hypothetical protein